MIAQISQSSDKIFFVNHKIALGGGMGKITQKLLRRGPIDREQRL